MQEAGLPVDFVKLKLEFGTYTLCFKDNAPTNRNKARSIEAILISISPNVSGFYHIMSLQTGKQIRRKHDSANDKVDHR